MKRRSFAAALGALVATPFVPQCIAKGRRCVPVAYKSSTKLGLYPEGFELTSISVGANRIDNEGLAALKLGENVTLEWKGTWVIAK